MIEKGANINAKKALVSWAEMTHLHVVQYLVEHGCTNNHEALLLSIAKVIWKLPNIYCTWS
jgi:hypothetical protein